MLTKILIFTTHAPRYAGGSFQELLRGPPNQRVGGTINIRKYIIIYLRREYCLMVKQLSFKQPMLGSIPAILIALFKVMNIIEV